MLDQRLDVDCWFGVWGLRFRVWGCVVVTEAGSYLRLIDFFITQLKAQGPSRTCNESKEEGEEEFGVVGLEEGGDEAIDLELEDHPDTGTGVPRS